MVETLEDQELKENMEVIQSLQQLILELQVIELRFLGFDEECNVCVCMYAFYLFIYLFEEWRWDV